MGGTVDGVLLPLVCEILGIDDIEGMLRLMRIVISEERNNAGHTKP